MAVIMAIVVATVVSVVYFLVLPDSGDPFSGTWRMSRSRGAALTLVIRRSTGHYQVALLDEGRSLTGWFDAHRDGYTLTADLARAPALAIGTASGPLLPPAWSRPPSSSGSPAPACARISIRSTPTRSDTVSSHDSKSASLRPIRDAATERCSSRSGACSSWPTHDRAGRVARLVSVRCHT